MIEIYDCTLREGEQAEGASFSFKDRIELCERLDDFGVDYIELGWPLASQEIFDAFRVALNSVKRAKIVAFGSTSIRKNPSEDYNLNSIVQTGVKYACIFGKSSVEQVEKQLGLTKEENLKKIYESIGYLREKGIIVFYDAEHYFEGFKKDEEYVLKTIFYAAKAGAERIILCDTTGGILPDEARWITEQTKEFLLSHGFNVELGVHFHDDSGLALANTLSCLPYIKQVQGTINGIGERLGNLNFSEFLPVYMKKMKNPLDIDLKKLKEINETGFRLAGINIPETRAFVGDSAFMHKGGVHIDATLKGASYEHESPEEFGNKRMLLLNSLGGRNSVIKIAREFGYELDKNNPEVDKKISELFEELKSYEVKRYKIGSLNAEQFLLINKYFGKEYVNFRILEWEIHTRMMDGKEKSFFNVVCELDGRKIEESLSIEGGPVNAAFKTLVRILEENYPEIKNLHIKDFHVSIAVQNKEASAVRTQITFQDGEEFDTVGVHNNILGSAIEALEKGFRYYLLKKKTLLKSP
jgi:2-isopropylmalate synthase